MARLVAPSFHEASQSAPIGPAFRCHPRQDHGRVQQGVDPTKASQFVIADGTDGQRRGYDDQEDRHAAYDPAVECPARQQWLAKTLEQRGLPVFTAEGDADAGSHKIRSSWVLADQADIIGGQPPPAPPWSAPTSVNPAGPHGMVHQLELRLRLLIPVGDLVEAPPHPVSRKPDLS